MIYEIKYSTGFETTASVIMEGPEEMSHGDFRHLCDAHLRTAVEELIQFRETPILWKEVTENLARILEQKGFVVRETVRRTYDRYSCDCNDKGVCLTCEVDDDLRAHNIQVMSVVDEKLVE